MIVPLPSNRVPERFYRGGSRITDWRGEPAAGSHEPEDWVASVTTLAGDDAIGLTALPDGTLLRDAIAADPAGWLGEEHVERHGTDTRLLVKLLDPGQRLPVHAHPSDDWAAAHLGRAHGKAEAWYILSPGIVHVGLREDVDAAQLARLVDAQDTDALLALLHEVAVQPGDVVWVPPGELHAIGEGVFLLELQQPEDLSILLEWRGFELDGTRDGHLGVGFDTALGAVNLRRRADVRELVHTAPATGSQFPAAADAFFRLDRIVVDGLAALPEGFAVLVVTDGTIETHTAHLPGGSTAVVSADASRELRGAGVVLVCRPPA